MALTNKPYFHYEDKLVLTKLDPATDWNNINLTSPISRNTAGLVHPFVAGEDFLGILSNKNIKNINIEDANNTIEVSYLKGGYIFNVIAKETLALGDWVKAAAGGFVKATNQAEAVGRVAQFLNESDNGAVDTIVKVRGGNY